LREAFLWSETRSVAKQTATVSLLGNEYEVDPALAGRRCELVYDPFDLTRIEVRYQQRAFGIAVPVRIGRHTHPRARRQLEPPATATESTTSACSPRAATQSSAASASTTPS